MQEDREGVGDRGSNGLRAKQQEKYLKNYSLVLQRDVPGSGLTEELSMEDAAAKIFRFLLNDPAVAFVVLEGLVADVVGND